MCCIHVGVTHSVLNGENDEASSRLVIVVAVAVIAVWHAKPCYQAYGAASAIHAVQVSPHVKLLSFQIKTQTGLNQCPIMMPV